MKKNPTLTVVAAALVDGRGRVLLQQRPPGRAMAGLWEFPGGKVEPGELPEAALIRELEEELGIIVTDHALEPISFASAPLNDAHLLLLLYLCRQWSGEAQALDASALRWVSPGDLDGSEMPPADLGLIAPLQGRLESEPFARS